ncbi:choice-of-anchor I family protein [Psychroserpens sp. Hel_I_66]|uniref:choice-of-anchor I family protein n=1 Tax=Psychroserpens sp. Hel_I_66 TaxID=1250004 RepID=UPI00068A7DE9|nr:choice-of-anchor I family protein [Psychroserpens sp. Hel_I_66]
MKKLLLISIIFISNLLNAQLNTGDMAFIAFNADGDDDFAMVTFVDIPANTSIYFSDKEWTGTEFNSGEASYEWQTGANIIPAGTIITFYTISHIPTVSFGTIAGSPGGLSSGSEAIFAFQGVDIDTPTTFIAAISNSTSGYGDLSNTGLNIGTTAITYPEGTDIGVYNGPRNGLQPNGYLIALNNLSNYDFQDSDEDDHNDGIAPDVPFDTTEFLISTTDLTTPSVTNVIVTSSTTLAVVFSEEIIQTSAENISNYSIDNGVTINSITYNNVNQTATLSHSGFTAGTAYTISVSDMADTSGNIQNPAFTSDELFFNNTSSGLIITEIMYNAPSDDSNALEFIEVFNNGTTSIELGGIQIRDESNFIFTFPAQTLLSGEIVLLATDKTTADAFYGVTFLDLPQGISNALGNGGEVLQILNSEQTVIFEMEYSDDAPWPTEADGDGPSLELQNPNGDFNEGTNWAPATNLVGQSLGDNVFASPGTFVPNVNVVPQISFAEATYNISEDGGFINIIVEVSSATTNDISFDVSLVTDLITASQTSDFTFNNQTYTIPANSNEPIEINIPIVDDGNAETDELFLLQILNPENANIGSNEIAGIYILDNDTMIPTATDVLGITYETSYLVDGSGSAEISAHDPKSERLFVLNSIGKTVEILDFSDVTAITTISSIDLSALGSDGPTSVATNNGLVVAAVSNGTTADGVIVFMDLDGNNMSSVTVGNLPDMVAFTPDGTKVLVANEGQPNSDYSIDPEGSISVIDITGGLGDITQANVTSINFNAFDGDKASLQAQDVRIFGPGSSVSQDLEPEYITFSANSQTAWVSLQENNAIAVVDLLSNTVTNILPLGLKDHNLPQNTLDTSNDTDFIFFGNWPIKGMYMPDAIASYEVAGTTYLVTANEGDAREYDALEEEVNIGDLNLDATIFPNATLLELEANLGALSITNATGDTDNDGDFDEIHAFGSRSFSIWNTATGNLVYDSGDDFERITAADPTYGVLFNVSNSNNTFKNRSDNKGPEPEGITVAEIYGEFYAFITLERIGGFMTYNITNPENPVFEKYVNNRSLGDAEGGDLGPEGIIYIDPTNSPTGSGLIVLSNEVSSTVSVYNLTKDKLSVDTFTQVDNSFKIFPNPATSNQTLFFNQTVDISLFDINGREILSEKEVSNIKLPSLSIGTYVLKTSTGETLKVIIK